MKVRIYLLCKRAVSEMRMRGLTTAFMHNLPNNDNMIQIDIFRKSSIDDPVAKRLYNRRRQTMKLK